MGTNVTQGGYIRHAAPLALFHRVFFHMQARDKREKVDTFSSKGIKILPSKEEAAFFAFDETAAAALELFYMLCLYGI
jgi:hypothetical protein